MTSVSVRIDKVLVDAAAAAGLTNDRSTAQQLNFWGEIGKNALANPDLPVEFVRDILIARKRQPETFGLMTAVQYLFKIIHFYTK